MNKKYCLISSLADKATSLEPLIKKVLDKKLIETKDPEQADYLFINGGDGTFIKHAIKHDRQGLKIIGINGGTLGFYTTFNENNFESIIDCIDDLEYTNLDFIRLRIDNEYYNALNEFNINSTTAYGYDIYINNEFYQKFRGTGLLISTRTGSTGINKSANGAILFPGINALQIVEMNPLLHSSFMTIQSPIILPINVKIRIEIKENYCDGDACPRIIADGTVIKKGLSSTLIEFDVIKSKAEFIFANDLKSFIQRLQKTFIS
ncbi:NAD(+) kinase [Mycoplasma bradburyae]|uniref:NAD kinase n=1 Tax=Mycoplasma bradburyae TaxID=2963128 RepID=A0ABT5GB83_9MOLU|nr:NAD(+) kinase [Mycoplasma bradburyae]MDC4181641.1 NAD(+) kinase [Mycoplasma bradburyae]UTS69937.1 NAD(+) kinase [Mycoplasma bradburyae]